MADSINFDKLVIDRVVDGWFENSDLELLAVLDDIQNFSINTTSETKDKTDSTGALIKRFYTAKSVEVSGENAVFSMNLAAIQMGTNKQVSTTDTFTMPRILMLEKPATAGTAIALPDIPIGAVITDADNDGVADTPSTIIVYGTFENGIPNTELKYKRGEAAGEGTYSITVANGVASITLPTDATDYVQVKYEYTVNSDKYAVRVDQEGSSFPKECKATFRVLCSDVCDAQTVRAFYIVFPRFQMAPDFDWTVDTESAQGFSATAFKDYCKKNQILYYIALAEDSDKYDAAQYNQ